MRAAMQITQAIKPLDAQRQAGEQPGDLLFCINDHKGATL
jgi:hypothetical protein